VSYIKFSKGGHYLAAAIGTNLQIYQTYTGTPVATLRGHNNRIKSVVWLNYDSQLMSVGTEGTVYYWDLFPVAKKAEHYPGTVPIFTGTGPMDGSTMFISTHDKMLKELLLLSRDCIKELQRNTDMMLTEKDKRDYHRAKTCHICDKPFGESKALLKVRDHDHITGKFRGAAHNCCNVNYFSNRFIPVVFHNLRGYDGRLIIKEAWKLYNMSEELAQKTKRKNRIFDGEISVIPNSNEKFMSFKIGYLRFIDSFQFMRSPLDKLVQNLRDEKG
jgi:hypothetical protein